MAEKKYVPVYVKDYITADKAVEAYKRAIAFIDTYGHAYISNGPFMITKIDTTANYIELSPTARDTPTRRTTGPTISPSTSPRSTT
jgi:hypothetical protein